jgi:hypothetical protein
MKNLPQLLLLVASLNAVAQNKEVTKFKITGLVEKPMVLNIDSLKTRKVIVGKSIKIIALNGQVVGSIINYRGVTLKSLLDEAKITISNVKERGLYYILITSNDGSKAIFSWNELYSGSAGEKTMILFENNNRPIAKDGSMSLICTADIFTEPRYIKSIQSIEMAKIKSL